MAQFHFDPDTYMDLMAAEVPGYARLQEAVAAATAGHPTQRILDLGTGTGITALSVLTLHSGARLVGVDESREMLQHARRALPDHTELRIQGLTDPLPEGPFDLAISALAIHHLDGPGKADLFRRVAAALHPGGRFVLGDLVVPDDPADVVTPIDGEFDQPSGAEEQLQWLRDAGFDAAVAWSEKDLAVLVGQRTAAG